MAKINYDRARSAMLQRMARDKTTAQAQADELWQAHGQVSAAQIASGLRALAARFKADGERKHLARMAVGYNLLRRVHQKATADLGVSPSQLGIAASWALYRRGKL